MGVEDSKTMWVAKRQRDNLNSEPKSGLFLFLLHQGFSNCLHRHILGTSTGLLRTILNDVFTWMAKNINVTVLGEHRDNQLLTKYYPEISRPSVLLLTLGPGIRTSLVSRKLNG